jgi:hypothetical protein
MPKNHGRGLKKKKKDIYCCGKKKKKNVGATGISSS